MNNQTKSISFTTDILKAVSDKNNIPLDIVKYSFDIMLRNLEEIVKQSSATSIFIPEIGTLFANYERLKAVEKGMKRKGENTEIVRSKIENIEKFSETIKDKQGSRTNRHLQRKFLNNRFFTKGLSLEQIEDKQNETGE